MKLVYIMNNPIVLFTNLFTLENKCVNQNKYIEIYHIWLNNIIKYGKLQDKDYCISFIDEVSYKYISERIIFRKLVSMIRNCHFIIYKQPKTIKEGIMKRYEIEHILKITENINSLNPNYLYLDVDVIVVNDISKLFQNETHPNKTTIYLKADTNWEFLNGMFYGELATNEDKEILKSRNIKLPGFSAGIFGWNNSYEVKQYFDFIRNKALVTSKVLYTVEQPFFNAAVFNYFFKDVGKFNFNILDNNKIKINVLFDKFTLSNEYNKVVLIDFCGEPGDDSLHWGKIFSQLLLQDL